MLREEKNSKTKNAKAAENNLESKYFIDKYLNIYYKYIY